MHMFLLLASLLSANGGPLLQPFSTAEGSQPPSPWRLVTVRNIDTHTQFDVIELDGERVLRAYSAKGAASLAHRLDLDPATRPRLRWRWRVDEMPASADLASRSGDDYAARVYVTFEPDPSSIGFGTRARIALGRTLFGNDTPAAALCYVWDNKHLVGHMAANAYTDRVGMIVLQSGEENLARWVMENRDVVADYEAYFGSAPRRITGVLVAADSDNTGERSLSYFGDLTLETEP